MKETFITLVGVVAIMTACSPTRQTTKDFSKNMDQNQISDTLSHAWGLVHSEELKRQKMDGINTEEYHKAFNRNLRGEETALDVEEAYNIVSRVMQEKQNQEVEMNKERGVAFLAENAKKEGVVVLPSGLQYQIVKAGDGPIPTIGQKVTTHYTGTLIDGTVFDSSVQRGEPITFPVGGVIQGWQEALQLMPKGSKWNLFIPEHLAYGSRGAGGVIPPYSALIFEIELLDVE